MSGEPTFDRTNPMHRVLFGVLAISHLVGAIVITLGVAYAWLWFLLLAVKALGFAMGWIAGLVSLLWLVWRFRLGREPLFSWYQPWDHCYWIVAARLGAHFWQRPANGDVR